MKVIPTEMSFLLGPDPGVSSGFNGLCKDEKKKMEIHSKTYKVQGNSPEVMTRLL